MNEANDNNQEVEVLAPSAVMALEKASIDVQVATAHQYPRSMEQFRKRALSMVTMDPETAESCSYCRPVGKEKNEKTGVWEQKYAEGPSIRLAEIVGASFGNIRVAGRIIEQTPRYVKAEGVAHDLESNAAWKSEILEATVTKEGVPYSERQRALMAKVAISKAMRDATFRVVPRALLKPIMAEAKKVAAGASLTLEQRRSKVRAWLTGLKVSDERVFDALNVKGWDDVGMEQIEILRGLKTAIEDKEETIESAFPMVAKAPENTGPTTQTATKTANPAKSAQSKPKEEAKMPQDAPTLPEATQQSPKAETPNSAQVPPDGAPKAEETTNPEEAEEEKAEAEAGLAPETTETTVQDVLEDPKLQPEQGDTDGIASIKMILKQNGVHFLTFWKWALSKHLRKEAQKDLRELAGSRVEAINRTLAKNLPEIKATK